jgi:hypothetical protein
MPATYFIIFLVFHTFRLVGYRAARHVKYIKLVPYFLHFQIIMRTILLALFIGIVTTLSLLALAYGFDSLGYPKISYLIFWQNSILQSFCPLINIGTPENPLYEGTPLNFLAFIASIPFGILIYSIAAYVFLFFKKKRRLTLQSTGTVQS